MDIQQLLDALNEQTRKVNELRAENEQAQEVIVKWIEANAAATTLINEQQAEIKRLRAALNEAREEIEEAQLIDNTPDEARAVRQGLLAVLGKVQP